MTTDPKIREAVETAVQRAGQPGSLAPLIVAWFDAVASGNEEKGDARENHRHLELLYAKTACESPHDSTAAPNDVEMNEEKLRSLTHRSEIKRLALHEPPDTPVRVRVDGSNSAVTRTVRILGWHATGLRCPDHSINCCEDDGNPHRVTLIQMPNGTGKTTTLNLLRFALSGSANELSPEEVSEYQKKGSDLSTGEFELKLAYNEKHLTVSMDFDFEQREVQYRTTYGRGQRLEFYQPPGLKKLMSSTFVDFYVFDGELADRLMDRNQTHAEQAIEALFQIHTLAKMKSKVVQYWEDITRNRTSKDERGYRRRLNNLEKWKARLNGVLAEKLRLDSELNRLNSDLALQQTKYEHGIAREHQLAIEIQNARRDVEEAERKVDSNSKDILDKMRDPHALSTSIGNRILAFKSGLDRVKLPESVAREFFEELCQEPECICGRPIDDHIRLHIRKRARRYLGSDDVSILNEIKSTIVDAVGASQSAREIELKGELSTLSANVREHQDMQNTLDELIGEAESGDPDVKKAKEICDELKRRITEVKVKLRRYEDKDHSISLDRIEKINLNQVFSIQTLEDGIEQLEKSVSEALNTYTILQKRKILAGILEAAHRSANQAIADEIRDQTNAVITELMPNNDIRIESIDGCLNLLGQRRGSVGETLSVGYAFLSTLFGRATYHELPFVVDSPANPIDLDVRDTIGRLVPKLSGQFVAFMISSERERFLDGIKSATESQIQFETVFRKGATDLETLAAGFSMCVQSRDGWRVPGERFFRQFQLDREQD